MLSQIDQKKIKLKLKSIYRYHLSEIDINGCCEEITKVINNNFFKSDFSYYSTISVLK